MRRKEMINLTWVFVFAALGLLWQSNIMGQNYEAITGKWRWTMDSDAGDPWFSKIASDKWGPFAYDKVQHFSACGLGVVAMRLMGATKTEALFVVMAVGLVKEIKDALVPWESYGRWGGDGFSFKDYLANAAGALIIGYLIYDGVHWLLERIF
jgi:uncharacterized protein YfiM (DUF2279 family)